MPRLAALLLVLTLAACQPSSDTPPPEAVTPTGAMLVNYEGRLDDGTVFDSGEGVEFDMRRLIPGMQDALVGMRAGETRAVTIPPEAAYGEEGIPGVIPPNATLSFDVTVLEIVR